MLPLLRYSRGITDSFYPGMITALVSGQANLYHCHSGDILLVPFDDVIREGIVGSEYCVQFRHRYLII